jgi:ketosteroid isomerase-like protein
LFIRHVDQAVIEVTFFPDNNRVAIARSLLPATDARETPPAEASYRNMHVFLKREDTWQCVAWQVTKVQ